MKKLHAIVSGRVQGVGFRYFVRMSGSQIGVAGWVRNMPDGRVEVEAEGSEGALDDFLTRLQQGPRMSRVDEVEHTLGEATGEYVGFEIH